ncbi:serine hydrolase domain-containing protein [Enterococcus sp. 5H]|uniref:serine hydrolase domain-containing protein n=1 Tax=Enterococcus sp. 5H TaxID=1229490 RepID=UPI00230486DB|nr:serine hydrolase domain-containing protein [Enterococcus sp. 5H]MDA9471469.1 Beta-lactamase [Enterococcus sp. 5H]
MHHGKHQKRNKRRRQFLFTLFLLTLISFEIYLLFFKEKQQNILPQTSTESSEISKEKTEDTEQIKNLNQDVLPSSNLALDINQKLTDASFIGSALVIKDNQIIMQKGFGYANASKKIANNSQSVFQIGSSQKGLTAALVLQQVQAQKLSLDETLDHFYPNIPDSSKITIRQLLSMNSGLVQQEKPTAMMSDEEFLRFEIAHAQMGTFGEFKYDAINYYLLVGILEKLTGSTYRTLLNQQIIQPLQLHHTSFYDDFLQLKNRTFAYEKKDNTDYAADIADDPLLFNQEVGTGSLGMTVSDLYTFYANLLAEKLVNKQTMDSLWTDDKQNKFIGGLYNCGNFIRGHGIEGGFEAVSYVSKDRKDAIILLTNQYPKNASYDQLTATLFSQLGPYKTK